MLKSGFRFILLFVAALISLPANAAPGFNGYYDYSTWTSASTFGEPVVKSIDGPQQTLTIMEPDYTWNWQPQEYTLSHSVGNSGVVSFDWSFNANVDPCCSGLNFYVNSTLFNLTGGYFGNPYNWNGSVTSGSFSTSVNAGDIITFGAFSADGCCQASTNIITNFSAPVPEPETYGMMLAGLGLMGFLARRRKNLAA